MKDDPRFAIGGIRLTEIKTCAVRKVFSPDEADQMLSDLILAIEERTEKMNRMAMLMVEARDALPAIKLISAQLRGIRLDLADRLERELEPWRIEE